MPQFPDARRQGSQHAAPDGVTVLACHDQRARGLPCQRGRHEVVLRLMLGAIGVDGVVGATVSGRLDAPALWRRTLGAALLLVTLALLILASGPTLAAALGAAAIGGAGMAVGEVLSETALPRMLDDDVLARAYGLAVPVSVVGIVAGSLTAGPLVALLGLSGALAAAGLAVLAAGGLLVCRPLSPAPLVTAAPTTVGESA